MYSSDKAHSEMNIMRCNIRTASSYRRNRYRLKSDCVYWYWGEEGISKGGSIITPCLVMFKVRIYSYHVCISPRNGFIATRMQPHITMTLCCRKMLCENCRFSYFPLDVFDQQSVPRWNLYSSRWELYHKTISSDSPNDVGNMVVQYFLILHENIGSSPYGRRDGLV